MKLDRSTSLLTRLFILAVLVLVTPTAFFALRAMAEFEQGMIPEMDKKAAVLGRTMAAQVFRAVSHGIPVDKLVGVDDFFDPVLAANPDISYLAITDRVGKVLFLRGADKDALEPHYQATDLELDSAEDHKASIGPYLDLALPVAPQGSLVAHVHVGFEQGYVGQQLSDGLYDVLVIMAVALVIAFEILLFLVACNVTGPLLGVGKVVDRARQGDWSYVPGAASGDEIGGFVRAIATAIRQMDARYRQLVIYGDEVKTAHFHQGVVEKVGAIQDRIHGLFRFSATGKPQILAERRPMDIRLPLFLFVFAEELSRAFLPLYIHQLGDARLGLSSEMIMAVPMAVFMACLAFAAPYGGRLVERLGARRVFLIGLVPAFLGYVMTGLAVGWFDLVAWRVLTGMGYAMVTLSCQSYVFTASPPGRRARGWGVFVGAVVTASISGTALGGVLAERFGMRATFFVSAMLVGLAGLLLSHLLDKAEAPADVDPMPRPKIMALLGNWRFSVLMLFAALPSKLALTGFLFFLVPVMLSAQGDWDLADMGGMMVLYPLVMALVSPVAAWLSDRLGWRAGLVALGGLIGGGSLLAPMVVDGPLGLMLAMAGLGLSHGLSATPQLALISDLFGAECRECGQTNILAVARLVEGLGAILGPLLVAAFIPLWGLTGAGLALGGLVLALAVMFALASFAYGGGPARDVAEDLP